MDVEKMKNASETGYGSKRILQATHFNIQTIFQNIITRIVNNK